MMPEADSSEDRQYPPLMLAAPKTPSGRPCSHLETSGQRHDLQKVTPTPTPSQAFAFCFLSRSFSKVLLSRPRGAALSTSMNEEAGFTNIVSYSRRSHETAYNPA